MIVTAASRIAHGSNMQQMPPCVAIISVTMEGDRIEDSSKLLGALTCGIGIVVGLLAEAKL